MKTILCAICVLTLAVSASGFDFYFDDAFTDGASPFDYNNNTAPSYMHYPTGSGLPSPGTQYEGGEGFDLEGLTVREKNGYIYIALANSFGWAAHSTDWENQPGYEDFWMGDLFIGIDGNDYSRAIDLRQIAAGGLGSTQMYNVSGGLWTGVPEITGGYGNYPIYSEITTAAGAFEIGDAAQADQSADVQMYLGMMEGYETDFGALESDGGDTYVWEFKFDKSLLGSFTTLDFHATLACGNDVLEGSYTTIPEPATILLFAIGLAGARLARRRQS